LLRARCGKRKIREKKRCSVILKRSTTDCYSKLQNVIDGAGTASSLPQLVTGETFKNVRGLSDMNPINVTEEKTEFSELCSRSATTGMKHTGFMTFQILTRQQNCSQPLLKLAHARLR